MSQEVIDLMNENARLRNQLEKANSALKLLSLRTLQYVGFEDNPKLECDQEMRRMANEGLALTGETPAVIVNKGRAKPFPVSDTDDQSKT